MHCLSGDVQDVGILTPYNGQVVELERLFSKVRKSLSGVHICISSVDGYQGQEADVIIFTTVRTNDGKKLGFVKDARRLNVAITRARRSEIGCLSSLLMPPHASCSVDKLYI